MWISEAINETIQEHGQAANVVETQGTCNPWLSELRLEGTTMSRLHARPQFQHVIRPGINFTMGIPLKGGSEIKGAAVARKTWSSLGVPFWQGALAACVQSPWKTKIMPSRPV